MNELRVELQHRLFIGTTRYGKSRACLSVNAPRFRLRGADRPAWVIVDSHGTIATGFAYLAMFSGLLMIYDRLAETSQVPGYEILVVSDNPDAQQRIAENRERISRCMGARSG